MTADAAFDDADLNGLVDGRLEPRRAAALIESLAADREAHARIDGWKRQNDSLRTMFASVLFEPVPIRLLPTAVAAGSPAATGGRAAGGSSTRDHVAGVMVTMAIGMALMGFAAGALTSFETNGFGLNSVGSASSAAADLRPDADSARRGFAEQAVAAHRTYLADPLRPVELTAMEEPKLLRWIQRRLNVSFHIPDLQRAGWSLVGGRVLPGRHGPAAFLVYGSGSERLGLYVAIGASLGDEGGGTVETAEPSGAAPVGVASWDDDQFDYALTSDRGAEWLDRNVETLRSAVTAQIRGDGTRH